MRLSEQLYITEGVLISPTTLQPGATHPSHGVNANILELNGETYCFH